MFNHWPHDILNWWIMLCKVRWSFVTFCIAMQAINMDMLATMKDFHSIIVQTYAQVPWIHAIWLMISACELLKKRTTHNSTWNYVLKITILGFREFHISYRKFNISESTEFYDNIAKFSKILYPYFLFNLRLCFIILR